VTSIVLRLAVIALLVYAGVAFWYGRMEERLQEQPHPSVEQKGDAAPPVQEDEASVPVSTDYSIIAARNIFQAGAGAAGHRGALFQSDEEGLERTKLHLALLGTVTGDADDARAIIRDEQTKLEDIYRTGGTIQGARINRISRGKVILLVHGREEVLTIKDPGSSGQGGEVTQRGGTRQVEAAPESPREEIENKVPEAQPRRRISFRSAAPPPPAAGQPAQPAPEEGQPSPPGGETSSKEPDGEKPAEELPPQRQPEEPPPQRQ